MHLVPQFVTRNAHQPAPNQGQYAWNPIGTDGRRQTRLLPNSARNAQFPHGTADHLRMAQIATVFDVHVAGSLPVASYMAVLHPATGSVVSFMKNNGTISAKPPYSPPAQSTEPSARYFFQQCHVRYSWSLLLNGLQRESASLAGRHPQRFSRRCKP